MLSLNHQNKSFFFFALVSNCVVELKLNGTIVDDLISGLNSDKNSDSLNVFSHAMECARCENYNV